MSAAFDYAPLLAPGLPPAAPKWSGFPRYNFVGGHNDPTQVPVADLTAAIADALAREGSTLATYGLSSGPLGHGGLRAFLAGKLAAHAGIACAPDDILITSGSLQGLDLVNGLLVGPGDTVLIERETYGGALTRLAKLGARIVGIAGDDEGIDPEALSRALDDCAGRGVRPKFLYTIPTVQNPTGTIMSLARRHAILRLTQAHGVPIFEDECYSDLVWSGERPPAFHALAGGAGVIHVGSFSKSIAPALRVGYVVAPADLLRRMLALKTDAGSGALEQMALAVFCERHFASHVRTLNSALHAKLDVLIEALEEHFGAAAEFTKPPGGIFLWLKLPDQVDTALLFQAAAREGIALNSGAEWSTDPVHSRSRLRLCFAYPDADTIRAGVAALARVCQREFGVPARIANVAAVSGG